MKKVTLAEFMELVKGDKALEEKMIEAAKKIGGGYRESLKALAAELGYDLAMEEVNEDLEALSDDALEEVAGGVRAEKGSYNPFCEWLMEYFGYDTDLCY